MARKPNIDNGLQGQPTKPLAITAVWQNGGFSAKFNGSSSIELLCKTEHLCFDFRHFAKLQTVVCNIFSELTPKASLLFFPKVIY